MFVLLTPQSTIGQSWAQISFEKREGKFYKHFSFLFVEKRNFFYLWLKYLSFRIWCSAICFFFKSFNLKKKNGEREKWKVKVRKVNFNPATALFTIQICLMRFSKFMSSYIPCRGLFSTLLEWQWNFWEANNNRRYEKRNWSNFVTWKEMVKNFPLRHVH